MAVAPPINPEITLIVAFSVEEDRIDDLFAEGSL
jgi:hypothetical protein